MIDYSDQAIRETMAGSNKGAARAAGYLLEVPADVRAAVNDEGHIRANLAGGRLADGVNQAVRDYLAGRDWQSATRFNTELIQQERAARL